MARALFWTGVALELLGLALVAASDYAPLVREAASAARRRLGPVWLRTLRLLGRRRSRIVHVGAAEAIATGGSVSVHMAPSENATLADKVAFLLRQHDRTESRLDELEARARRHPDQWRAELATARGELEERIERRLTETQERYLFARRVGLVCLLAGVTLVSASTL